MANGAFKFKDNYGNVVSFISGSGSDIVISGGTLNLSGMTGLTLGNITMSGTTQNATSASHAASYLLTSSFNTYSGTTDTIIGSLQTTTGSLNTFTSSATTRLNSIESKTGSYATTGSNTFNGNLTVTGYIDAQELRTTYISSSILYRSGSTKFGDELADTHSFSGSMYVSGSINTVGNVNTGNILSIKGIYPFVQFLSASDARQAYIQHDLSNLTIQADTGAIIFNASTEKGRFNSSGLAVTGSITNRGVVIDGANNANVAKLNFTRTDNSWGIHNETNLRIYVGSGNTTSPGTQVLELTTAGAATYSGTLQANGKIYLQRASNGADTLLQFKNEIGADRAYIKFGGTAEELAFYAGAGTTRNMIIESDGAMGFNSSTQGSRTYMFKAVGGRSLAVEITEATGVHSLYFRPVSSGRHLISANYLSGGVYLPLSLSGRENDIDLVLNNGNTGIGVASPSYKLDVQSSGSGVFGSTFTGAWTSGYLNHSYFMAPSLTGGAVSLAIGVANSSYNVGKVVFNYSGNGDTGNSLGLGFWDNDNVLRVFANNKVYIGGPTNPGNGLSLPGPIQAGRSNVNFLDPGSTGNVLAGTTFFVPTSYDSTNNGYVRISQDSSTISFTTDWDGHIAGGTLKTIIFKHGQAGNGVQLTNGATSWSSYTSDARTKTIHRTIENTGLETISKLNGVVYTMSKVDEKYGPDTKLKIGFTAQNVQEAIPEAVFTSYQDEELGDVLTYTPDYIIPYLVESIKELKAEIEILKNN